MATRPNPVRLGFPLNYYQVTLNRHPDCDFEDKCLDKAAGNNWRGFTCADCIFFKRYRRMRIQINEIFRSFEQTEGVLDVYGIKVTN